jgi:Ca2+-binding EF-hand superfamily protein
MKMALATGTVAVVGAVFLVGSSYAERGFGPRMGFGGFGGGLGGHGGPMMREMLASVDTNGDQALTQDEINAYIAKSLADFDANNDGQLSLEEFQGLWAQITRPMAVRAFQFLDPNGDAEVSKQELDDRFGKAVEKFDRNGDGKLDQNDRGHRRFGMRGGPGGGRGGPGWMHDDDGPGRGWGPGGGYGPRDGSGPGGGGYGPRDGSGPRWMNPAAPQQNDQ